MVEDLLKRITQMIISCSHWLTGEVQVLLLKARTLFLMVATVVSYRNLVKKVVAAVVTVAVEIAVETALEIVVETALEIAVESVAESAVENLAEIAWESVVQIA